MSMIGDDAVSGTRERSVAEIIWTSEPCSNVKESNGRCPDDCKVWTSPDGSRWEYGSTPGVELTVDDMLAWLRRRCSQIRIDPIRIHEVGYTLDCTDETEPMQPNRVMASVTAPTFHAALEAAVRAVAEAEGGAG